MNKVLRLFRAKGSSDFSVLCNESEDEKGARITIEFSNMILQVNSKLTALLIAKILHAVATYLEGLDFGRRN